MHDGIFSVVPTAQTARLHLYRGIAKRFSMHFLIWSCWCFAGILALADFPIPVNVYSWIAVVVLPVNSAVNPILYSLSEILQKKVKILTGY